MADESPSSGSSAFADATALQDIATNGALLNQATSRLIQTLERMGDIVLPAAHGGTGLASYVIGDILYANSTTSLARLADVAVGKVLVSGGVGAPPAWGDVPAGGLSGEVPVVNGGTGLGTLTANNLLVGAGTSDVTFIAPGTNGQSLVSNGTTWAASSGATAAQYQANTSTAPAIRPSEIWSAANPVALTDAATVALDFSAGLNFVLTDPAGNRTLGNPTNMKAGQAGVIYVANSSGATRTIDVDTAWLATAGSGFPVSVANNTYCLIAYFCITTSIPVVTGVINNPI